MIRTTQTFAFLPDIIKQVGAGQLAPAGFQRPYVWSRNDVEEMWASIASCDPLGGILLWSPEDEETVARMARPNLGPITMTPSSRSSLILDGQNRLVTLAWSMFDPATVEGSCPGGDIWKTPDDLVLVADPVTNAQDPCIRFMPRTAMSGLMTPVWLLFDNSTLQRHFRQNWNASDTDGEIAVDWLSRVQDSLREARVVISTINGGNAEQAKRRFLRMARVGVPMSEADFDLIANSV